MIKVKVTIQTDVEFDLPGDNLEDGREINRKIHERLILEGYKNLKVLYTKTSLAPDEKDDDDHFISVDDYMNSKHKHFHGKP